jgi:uncharacterized RDD family membrane protein YckC
MLPARLNPLARLSRLTRSSAQRRWLTAEPLNVAPALVGLPLATPQRRALAMGVDLAGMALLAGVGGFWLVGGLALVALLLRGQRAGVRKRLLIGWVFAAGLGVLALQDAYDRWGPNRDVHRAAVAAEAQADAAAEATEAAAEAAVEAAANSASAPGLSDAQRIARLEAQIVALRKPQPFKWREQFDRAVESVGVSFGWGFVYFSLLPAWWNGQTLGKKLFRLRVVELTGRPLTVMRCLRRYGGYAAGMATGGLGFLQALWDVNRQGIQDRVAHTVVVDLRASAAPVVASLVSPGPAA